jgi:hypothetical protein
MKTVNNPSAAFRFQHNGIFYNLPPGLSEWPDDVAGHIQRKYLSREGVRVQYPAPEQPAAPAPVAEGAHVIAEVPPVVVPEPEKPQTETPTEVPPEQPAAPIEGEQKPVAPEQPAPTEAAKE